MFGAAMLAALASLLTGQAIHSELPSFLYTSTPRYDAAAWTHGGDRFPSGAHLVLVTPEGHRSLVPSILRISRRQRVLRWPPDPVCRPGYQAGSLADLGGRCHRRHPSTSGDVY